MKRDGGWLLFGVALVLAGCGGTPSPASRTPQKSAVAETTAADLGDLEDAPRVSKPQHADDAAVTDDDALRTDAPSKSDAPRRNERHRAGGFSGYK